VIEDESFRRKGRDPSLAAGEYGMPLEEVRTSWKAT
jgi:hypothetical protein